MCLRQPRLRFDTRSHNPTQAAAPVPLHTPAGSLPQPPRTHVFLHSSRPPRALGLRFDPSELRASNPATTGYRRQKGQGPRDFAHAGRLLLPSAFPASTFAFLATKPRASAPQNPRYRAYRPPGAGSLRLPTKLRQALPRLGCCKANPSPSRRAGRSAPPPCPSGRAASPLQRVASCSRKLRQRPPLSLVRRRRRQAPSQPLGRASTPDPLRASTACVRAAYPRAEPPSPQKTPLSRPPCDRLSVPDFAGKQRATVGPCAPRPRAKQTRKGEGFELRTQTLLTVTRQRRRLLLLARAGHLRGHAPAFLRSGRPLPKRLGVALRRPKTAAGHPRDRATAGPRAPRPDHPSKQEQGRACPAVATQTKVVHQLRKRVL